MVLSRGHAYQRDSLIRHQHKGHTLWLYVCVYFVEQIFEQLLMQTGVCSVPLEARATERVSVPFKHDLLQCDLSLYVCVIQKLCLLYYFSRCICAEINYGS